MTNEQALLTIAEAAESFAKILRRSVSTDGAERGEAIKTSEGMLSRARQIHSALGPVQARGLVELHRAEPHGLTNRQVRDLLNHEDVGTHQMLMGLCRVGLAERDESARPMIYRLGPKLREG